jgi:class 3 adenylate cyclase
MRRPVIALQHMQAYLSSGSNIPWVRAIHSYGHMLRDRPVRGKDRQAVNFLRSLQPAEREAFESVAVEAVFPRNARLMSEGEPANYVMVIRKGWTQITVRSPSGERVIAERGPGQLVGERAAFRQNVRSATVTALDEVAALVMPTSDFASFISAHPRVLDVVENQIYDRLTEDPEGYAPDGWPDGLPLQIAGRGPGVRPRAQALTGENCTVIRTDVVGFTAEHRNDGDRQIIRIEGLKMMQASLGTMWDESIIEDRGDGLLIVVPPHVATGKVMECLHRDLPGKLRAHNRRYSESVQIRLRVAVNVGPVVTDGLGMTGDALIRATRLVEAPAFKDEMIAAKNGLGIIVSEFVYDTVVGHAEEFIDPGEYRKVEVRLKGFSSSAWLRLFDFSAENPSPRSG